MSTSKIPSAIPGRRHRMVRVDFSNPYLRCYLAGYCASHRALLDGIRGQLDEWLASARARAQAAPQTPQALAAVLDIDEVVLSNIHMNSHGEFHAADFFGWPRGAALNPLLPGARELIEALQQRGARVFFVTGRAESLREETVANFLRVGLAEERAQEVRDEGPRAKSARAPFSAAELRAAGGARQAATLIMCPDAALPAPGESIRPFKEEQRRLLAQVYHIALNVGDQVSDLGYYGDVQALTPHPFYFTP